MLTQVAELSVPMFGSMQEQIELNSDQIYQNTMHRYEMAKSAALIAQTDVDDLRSKVEGLMKHIDVMVGMPLESLNGSSPSLKGHQTEISQMDSKIARTTASLQQQVNQNTNKFTELEGSIRSFNQELTNSLGSFMEQLKGSVDSVKQHADQQVGELRQEMKRLAASVDHRITDAVSQMETRCTEQLVLSLEGRVTAEQLDQLLGTVHTTASDVKLEAVVRDLNKERAARLSSEHLLTSVQAEQTAALGELSSGFSGAIQQNEAKIEHLHHACADQVMKMHKASSKLDQWATSGAERLELLEKAVEGVTPKVDALESWVQEDAPRLISEECTAVKQRVDEVRLGAGAAHETAIEGLRVLTQTVAEGKRSTNLELKETLKDYITKQAALDEYLTKQAAVGEYVSQHAALEERERAHGHLDNLISSVSATQEEHMDCVHKLNDTSKQSLQLQLQQTCGENLEKCEASVSERHDAVMEVLRQQYQAVQEQLESFKSELTSEMEAKVVPIVAKYCVGALADNPSAFAPKSTWTPRASNTDPVPTTSKPVWSPGQPHWK
eukprot:TRINITY_DN18406_c0_g1_i1.p1 TRINITY_DN18406_c0_g1~~TRINITY_DN18406_c0_g1_i1.p1  ORF type:complete len:554 (+),score=182.49 TRINITY_DN18406_c0_g1_i1:1084-2745(+)